MILYVDDQPRAELIRQSDLTAFFMNPFINNKLYTIRNLFNQKVILQRNFDDLAKDINLIKHNVSLAQFHSLAKDLEYYLDSAEECIYLRPKTVDLDIFLSSTIDRWKAECGQDEYMEGATGLINRIFIDMESHGFYFDDSENSLTIAESLKTEVIDYYGSSCWYYAELLLNDMDLADRSKLDLAEIVDILYCSCQENA